MLYLSNQSHYLLDIILTHSVSVDRSFPSGITEYIIVYSLDVFSRQYRVSIACMEASMYTFRLILVSCPGANELLVSFNQLKSGYRVLTSGTRR